jgi:DNA topoisomerase-1
MGKIQESTKDFQKKEEKIIEKAKTTITKISKDFELQKEKIGSELLKANIKQRKQEKEENKLCLCQKCKKGNLAITYSKKTKKHFVACDAYPKCKTTYSLPQKGTIKKTGKICEECGFPLMMSVSSNRKPWFFCFNKDCPVNKKRLEEYNKHLQEKGEN